MGEVLFGTTLLAAFLGGLVALLAPCCVSVMLPAYLATGFRHRGGVVASTLVFGAGVGTVILPIGLGATVLSGLLVSQHLWVFSLGGVSMIAGGVAVLVGWKPHLPMPGARAVREGSFGSAYALVALAWDRRRERATRLLTDRTVGLRLGRWRRRMALGSALSGLLMIGMGVLAVVLAFTGPGMPSGGWQTELSAWLQHLSSSALRALAWIPGWMLVVVLAVGFTLVIRRAARTPRTPTEPAVSTSSGTGEEETEPGPIPVTVQENRRDQDQR
ncbi:MAG: cytochrome c biogenesis CcdA family protein [Pseudonocardiaceae bacterium]